MLMAFKSLLTRTGFQQFTPDNHQTPIFRFDLFDRLVGPGFNYINPLFEKAYPPVKTSIRVADLFFEKLLSADSIPMEAQLTVLFKLDLIGCNPKIIAQFVTLPQRMLQLIIKDYTAQALMQLVGRHRADTLKNAAVQNEIKNSLFRAVNANVAPLGLSIPAAECITFRHFMPHAKYVRTMLENANIGEKLKQLNSADEKAVDFLIRTGLVDALERLPDGSMVMTQLGDGANVGGVMNWLNGRFSPPPTPPRRPSYSPYGTAEAD